MNENIVELIQESKKMDSLKEVKQKKISFIGAILLIISSCIGSGIFFKSESVLSLNSGSFIFSLISWIISSIAVICMAIALIEIVSKGSDNLSSDNLSLIGWAKKFNNSFIFRCCKNFMFFIYMPLEYFYLPYYTIISLQNMLKGFGVGFSFGTSNDWVIWMIIGMLISSWFIFTSGINTKIGDIQNKIMLSLKFIPIISIVILGMVIMSKNGVDINLFPKKSIEDPTSFYQIWPGFGMFLSLSAIFFAYDGFYFAAGIQKEMKEPKKTPKAILFGLLIVTFVYLTIAIVMSIASTTGSFNGESGFENFLRTNNLSWLFGILNLLIACSVIGSLNGFTMWATRLTENLIIDNELPFSKKLVSKINPNKPIVGAIYVFCLSTIAMFFLSLIGGLSYIPNDYLDSNGNSLYDSVGYFSAAKLFTFTNLMSSWASIFAFTFIILILIGGLLNRKSNRVDVERNKYFIPTSIISIIIVGLSLTSTIVQPFVNLFLINGNMDINQKISRVMLVVVLFIFLSITIIPSFFETKSKKRSKDNI